MDIKKRLVTVLAACIMMLFASPFVLATTPQPADNVQQTQTVDNTSSTSTVQPQIPAAGNVQTETAGTEFANKKYMTKGWTAFWIIFSIIVNMVLSFWIGNRFYRLAKKDNHHSYEIRALRKDIEEKFAKSVGGFSEQEIEITNSNESLATDDEGIKIPEKQQVFKEVSPEEEERFRKWEQAQARPKTERTAKPKSVLKEELQEDLDDVKKINRKNYQPKRDDEAEIDATREIKIKSEDVKSKAKEILGDIFPFKED